MAASGMWSSSTANFKLDSRGAADLCKRLLPSGLGKLLRECPGFISDLQCAIASQLKLVEKRPSQVLSPQPHPTFSTGHSARTQSGNVRYPSWPLDLSMPRR